MKLLFDLFPVALFYSAFQYTGSHRDWAAEKATAWLGFMISGGSVGPNDAPTLLNTVVLVAALAVQIVILKIARKPVSSILWAGLGLALVFGSATVWFHDKTLIMWKFTVFYLLLALTFLASRFIWKRNLVQSLMREAQLELPDNVLDKLNLAWIGFFLGMATVNIFVAYSFSESTWYNFKMFVSPALMVAFILAQGFVLVRYVPVEEKK
ncbi:MAG: septation protein IspZ [Methylococcaceae bacterium]|nr:septation protein IspZ [Methylococcaceae bacterium]